MVILSSFEYLLHASPIMKPIIYLALKPIPIKYFHKYIVKGMLKINCQLGTGFQFYKHGFYQACNLLPISLFMYTDSPRGDIT